MSNLPIFTPSLIPLWDFWSMMKVLFNYYLLITILINNLSFLFLFFVLFFSIFLFAFSFHYLFFFLLLFLFLNIVNKGNPLPSTLNDWLTRGKTKYDKNPPKFIIASREALGEHNNNNGGDYEKESDLFSTPTAEMTKRKKTVVRAFNKKN